jgi:hypothetical protein
MNMHGNTDAYTSTFGGTLTIVLFITTAYLFLMNIQKIDNNEYAKVTDDV